MIITAVLRATDTIARRTIVLENDFLCFAAKCRAIKKGQFTVSFKSTILVLLFSLWSHTVYTQKSQIVTQPGAWNTSQYLPLIQNKKVAVVANQTSLIGKTHLVDSLLKLKINIVKIFGPEHGFRGNAANGEHVSSGKDLKTGLPVISLYGKHREPTAQDFSDIDLVIFDLQDVGVRFYTHLTTLHHVMKRCALESKPLIILDRPNPNGYYTDGPIHEPKFTSDVGVHPIPIVHGMTLGELGQMINGEKWLGLDKNCDLVVIKIKEWNHNKKYVLPIPPSPNLASQEAIYLYPSMGLFEGIDISVGRGTDHPFECFGAPWLKSDSYVFVPREIPGKTLNPPYKNDTCYGYLVIDFAKNYIVDYRKLYIEWLEMLLHKYPNKQKFFNSFFDKLAGTDQLRLQILNGTSVEDIRKSWQPGLDEFRKKRKQYLLYSFDEELGLTW